LAVGLLRDALHVPLPAYKEARIASADLTDIKPAARHADLVIQLTGDEPELGIIVEVQLGTDEEKRFSWPAYVTNLRARLKCPACIVVVTVSEAMAEWCRETIELGPGNVFTPFVLAPAALPVIDDEAAARRNPELAVLSCVAHGRDPDVEAVARSAAATLSAVRGLTNGIQPIYSDMVYSGITDAARAALEDLMVSGNYEFQSDFAKKHQAKGREEGRQEGRHEGEVAGQARALLAVLESRGLHISQKARTRIVACIDIAQLDAWVRRAASVATVDELF
jgi:hypothetical protein